MLTRELSRLYPGIAGAQPGYDCLYNGFHNVALATHADLYARAVFVGTDVGKQTYLVDRENAYCYGWTYLTREYPELTLHQIALLGGCDVTAELVRQALQITADAFRFRDVLEALHPHIGDIRKKLYRTYLAK